LAHIYSDQAGCNKVSSVHQVESHFPFQNRPPGFFLLCCKLALTPPCKCRFFILFDSINHIDRQLGVANVQLLIIFQALGHILLAALELTFLRLLSSCGKDRVPLILVHQA
jgi:hypothetical protein